MAFVYAWIVPLWAAQLLPQLLIEQFDTLRIQCRHIEHMHEGVYNFCLAQILLKSSFQNLGLLVLTITCQVFSLNLTVRGVSNKHCLLTFFIITEFLPCVSQFEDQDKVFCMNRFLSKLIREKLCAF